MGDYEQLEERADREINKLEKRIAELEEQVDILAGNITYEQHREEVAQTQRKAFEAGFKAGMAWYEKELCCISRPEITEITRAHNIWEQAE